MTRALPAVVAAIALLLAEVPAGARQEASGEPERGLIGVLRRDGIAVPFAAFRSRSWSVPWPVSLANLELPINIEAVPDRWWGGERPQGWTAWLVDGRQASIAPVAPVQFRVHCDRRLGLRTNHQPLEPPPLLPVEPFPKDGLVTTPGVIVQRIEAVPKESGAWGSLAASLIAELNQVEDRELAALTSNGFPHPVPRKARHGTAVQLEAWYRTTIDAGRTIAYVEAVRRYEPRPEDEGCGLETSFSGWVIDTERGRPRMQIGARVTYCDRVGVTYMLPLGRTRLHGREYWIAQLSGWDTEWYAVAQMSPERVQIVAEYFAGRRASCP